MSQYIRVYNGFGSSELSHMMTMKTLSLIAKEWQLPVNDITAEEIRGGHWAAYTRLLVIGGGFDRGYIEALGDHGMALISSYVNDGGAYLGICAGGYFGCREIEFALATDLEVVGSRPLRFFDGCCIGPTFNGFAYNSEDGAHAAVIERTDFSSKFFCYFNGGGYFHPISSSGVKVLARYVEATGKAAVILCNVGKGRAVLSGIHFEYDEEILAGTTGTDSVHPRIEAMLPSLRGSRAERLRFYKDVIATLLNLNPLNNISRESRTTCLV